MPESVSGVDAILDGLRERATGWSCVPLADAVAAVRAAADARTQETEAWLDELAAEARKDNTIALAYSEALSDAAGLLARRFPNKGTPA